MQIELIRNEKDTFPIRRVSHSLQTADPRAFASCTVLPRRHYKSDESLAEDVGLGMAVNGVGAFLLLKSLGALDDDHYP